MSVDFEATEHLEETWGDPEYWEMLEEQYGGLKAHPLTTIILNPVEVAALIIALQAAKGMTEDPEMYSLLESIYGKVYRELTFSPPSP